MIKVESNNDRCNVCNGLIKNSIAAALYKCNMGKHPICYTCFLRASKNGNPLCPKCNSLVMKTSSSAIFKRSENVTVEKLFQLPTEKINALLYRSTEKLNDATEKHWAPIKCPHSPCGKTVNPSSLHSHFIYEHSNIPIYQLTRGSELQVLTELSHLEHGASRCIGLIELLPSGCSFCILASASEECDPLLGYAVYWLVTNSQKQYQCTLETLSPSKASSCATFCKVIEARNNSSITAIIKAMGCLFLSYGTVKNLADDFGKLHLCIVIH